MKRAPAHPKEDGQGAYAVEIDPRLLDEALAVVGDLGRARPSSGEQPRTGRPVPASLRGMPVASTTQRGDAASRSAAPTRQAVPTRPPPLPPPPVDPEDLPTVEKFASDGPPPAAEVHAAETLAAEAPAPRTEHEPTRPTDFFQLRVELERTRVERDDNKARLEVETRERLKLVGRFKRATDDLERLNTRLESAETARLIAETTATAARDAARSSQDAVERVRERGRRAEEDYRKASALPLLTELLPTLENLERALATGRNHPEQLLGGLEIVVAQFQNALKRVGVERIEALPGVIFQPAFHEAVLYVAVYDAAPGTVVSEMQPGYLWQGKLLRPSRVSVAAPPQDAQLSLDQVEHRRARSALSEGEALSLPSDDVSHDADPEDAEVWESPEVEPEA